MILATIVNRWVRPYWVTHFVDDLIVALFIAGLLTLTVDPFIKKQARKEAMRDIFHHMLCFSLPDKIRERLQEIAETTKLYRKGMKQHIVMSGDGDFVAFDVKTEFYVVNPTKHPQWFPALIHARRKMITASLST